MKTLDLNTFENYELFLLENDFSLFTHSTKYKIFLEDLLECSSIYLYQEKNSKIVTTLPLMIKNGPLGKVGNSLPYYGSPGGILSSNLSPINEKVYSTYQGILKDLNLAASNIVESPWSNNILFMDKMYAPQRISQVTTLKTAASPEEHLSKIVDSSARRNVKKAEKSGVKVSINNDFIDFLEKTHVTNMKEINGKHKSHEFFVKFPKHFTAGKDYNVYVATIDGQPVSALLLFYYNKVVEYFTPVTVSVFRDKQPLALILWEAMKDAIKEGYWYWNWEGTWLSQDGVYKFKKKWGAQERPYSYANCVYNLDILEKTPMELTSWYDGFFIVDYENLRRK